MTKRQKKRVPGLIADQIDSRMYIYMDENGKLYRWFYYHCGRRPRRGRIEQEIMEALDKKGFLEIGLGTKKIADKVHAIVDRRARLRRDPALYGHREWAEHASWL